MKDKIFRFAPIILFSENMITFIVMFYLISCQNSYSQCLICITYIAFLILQTISSLICGFSLKKMHHQIHIDALTGLCNRKFFNEIIFKMKARYPVSLVLIDIDNFKKINDTYGHLIGDQVLQQFAEILQSNTRQNDITTRWGGEEFAVILPETSLEDACIIGNRIRITVEKYIFYCENITCNITVSIGVASIKSNMNIGVENLFKIADDALYKAKQKKNHISTIAMYQK